MNTNGPRPVDVGDYAAERHQNAERDNEDTPGNDEQENRNAVHISPFSFSVVN